MADKDLDFLYQCSNEQLKLLADFMLYDKDGKLRWTEEISSTQAFKLYYPHEMVKLVPTLIDELQKFGGNSFFNFFRGHGVSYREILIAVCKQLDVSYHKDASTELIEHYLLQKFLIMSVEKMTEEERKLLNAYHRQVYEKIGPYLNEEERRWLREYTRPV